MSYQLKESKRHTLKLVVKYYDKDTGKEAKVLLTQYRPNWIRRNTLSDWKSLETCFWKVLWAKVIGMDEESYHHDIERMWSNSSKMVARIDHSAPASEEWLEAGRKTRVNKNLKLYNIQNLRALWHTISFGCSDSLLNKSYSFTLSRASFLSKHPLHSISPTMNSSNVSLLTH